MNRPVKDYTTSVVRLGLQPGATMQRGGKTYVLNEHHRWTLPKQQGGPPTKPSQAAQQPQAKSPKQAQPQQPSNQPKQSPSGSQPRANAPSQQPAGGAAAPQFDKATGQKIGGAPGAPGAGDQTGSLKLDKSTFDKINSGAIHVDMKADRRVQKTRTGFRVSGVKTDFREDLSDEDFAAKHVLQDSNQSDSEQPAQQPAGIDDDEAPMGPPIDAKVDYDGNHDGITDQARVGVPANMVPPPPRIPRIKSLPKKAYKIQEEFCKAFEEDPDGMVHKALAGITSKAQSSGKPPVFETDAMKELNGYWSSEELNKDIAKRSENRAKYNTALHQAANAICKKAFVEHIKTLKPGDEILVTVGGCGAGKGYSLANDKDGKPFVPEAQELMRRAAVVWDSAGDQNATENTWLRDVANNHGLRLSFLFVHNDPYKSWAGETGAVNRAMKPDNGRMVDAKVFTDSYVIGAQNHANFLAKHAHDANISSVVVDCSSGKPVKVDRMPQSALELKSDELEKFCLSAIQQREDIPEHIRQAAVAGQQIWAK